MLVAFLVGFTIAVFAIQPEAEPASIAQERMDTPLQTEATPADSTRI